MKEKSPIKFLLTAFLKADVGEETFKSYVFTANSLI